MNSKANSFTPARLPIWLVLFSVASVYGGLGMSLANFPNTSIIYQLISLIFCLTGAMSMIWINYKANMWMKMICYLSLGILLALNVFRSTTFTTPKLEIFFGCLIALSFIWAYSLPITNPKLTWILRNELTSPSTSISKKVQALALYTPLLIGFIAAIVYDKGLLPTRIIWGMFCWFIATFLPFSTRMPIYPFEQAKQN